MTEEKSKPLRKRTSINSAFHYYEADFCKGCGQIYSSILGHWYHVRKSEKCRVYYTREQITLLSKQSKTMKTQAKNDYYQKKMKQKKTSEKENVIVQNEFNDIHQLLIDFNI